MERYSDEAIEIIDELHTERLNYKYEYSPLIDCANRLAAYEDTGLTPEEVQDLKDAEEQGNLVMLRGTSFSQIRTIMNLCERINGIKARRGQEIEPMITWQLYDILCKTFKVDEKAEAELKEINKNG